MSEKTPLPSDTSDTKKEVAALEIKRGTPEAMLFALERSNGIVTTACKNAGIARDTHYRWLKENPEYKTAVDMAAEIAIDFVESKLMALINGVTVETEKGVVYKRPPDVASVIFYLKTKAKHRGYVERTEFVNTDVVIEIEGNVITTSSSEG